MESQGRGSLLPTLCTTTHAPAAGRGPRLSLRSLAWPHAVLVNGNLLGFSFCDAGFWCLCPGEAVGCAGSLVSRWLICRTGKGNSVG